MEIYSDDSDRPYLAERERLLRDIDRRREITSLEEIDDILSRINLAILNIQSDLADADSATSCPQWRVNARRALVHYQSKFRQVDLRRNDIIRENRSPEERDGIRHKAFVVALNEWNDQQEPKIITKPLWEKLWKRADELMFCARTKPELPPSVTHDDKSQPNPRNINGDPFTSKDRQSSSDPS